MHGACHAAHVPTRYVREERATAGSDYTAICGSEVSSPQRATLSDQQFYTALARQERLDKEVRAIVKGKGKTQNKSVNLRGRKETDRRAYPAVKGRREAPYGAGQHTV